ncbi:MAG: hypothetical protein ACTSU2_07930 [Promethearchaeota archaeon]
MMKFPNLNNKENDNAYDNEIELPDFSQAMDLLVKKLKLRRNPSDLINNESLTLDKTETGLGKHQIYHNKIPLNKLNPEIHIKFRMNNSHLRLLRLFELNFGFSASGVYYTPEYLFYFIEKDNAKSFNNKSYRFINKFRNIFHKKVLFLYNCDNLKDLISEFFKHITISAIMIEPLKKQENITKYNVYVYVEDRYIPFALGQKGAYIHVINKFLKNNVGNYQIFLRSL